MTATPAPANRILSRSSAAVGAIVIPQPYLLFLGDVNEPGYAKTAFGLRDWARERCIGEYACTGAKITTGLPFLEPMQARQAGARSLVIGVANAGGVIPDSWVPALIDALHAGLDLVSGLHTRLATIAEIVATAQRLGRRLVEVRQPPEGIPLATGRKRSGRRLLTLGTDCALGKKYAALTLARALSARGLDATFRATGQTGILISGSGIVIDAVVADFAAGAAEALSPDAAPDHWDVIEGQGSLLHPSYAGVSLALLHGSQPDVVVVCHDPRRTHMLGYPDYPVPAVEEVIWLALQLGRHVNPALRCAGVCFNTSGMGEAAAQRLLAQESTRLRMPVVDPIRSDEALQRLVEACLE